MKNRIYAYCRISTMKQKIERQIDNIKAVYPDAIIITEDGVSGCTLDRPAWINLIKRVDKDIKAGRQVTLVFDEVSRMSRNATEGFELYQELFARKRKSPKTLQSRPAPTPACGGPARRAERP